MATYKNFPVYFFLKYKFHKKKNFRKKFHQNIFFGNKIFSAINHFYISKIYFNPFLPFSTHFNHSQPTSTHLTKIKPTSTYFNPLLPTSPIYQPLFTYETNRLVQHRPCGKCNHRQSNLVLDQWISIHYRSFIYDSLITSISSINLDSSENQISRSNLLAKSFFFSRSNDEL